MMDITKVLGITCLFFFQAATASPTANEFEPCNRGAGMLLNKCLDEAGMNTGSDCWTRAQSHHAQCRDRVMQSHSRDRQDRQRALADKAAQKK